MDNQSLRKNMRHNIRNIASIAFLIVIGIVVGNSVQFVVDWVKKPAPYKLADTSSHFEGTSNSVILYTTKWCPYCKRARQYFKEHHIAFEDRDIEAGNKRTDALYASLHQLGVPQIVMKGKIFSGFNKKLISEELQSRRLTNESRKLKGS